MPYREGARGRCYLCGRPEEEHRGDRQSCPEDRSRYDRLEWDEAARASGLSRRGRVRERPLTKREDNRMKIYVASSWRNDHQPTIVGLLRRAGHEVYDFRNPSGEGPRGAPDEGFAWSDIDPEWQGWSPRRYRTLLDHPVAERGFRADDDALNWADACVLVLPCGRSAHLELGYAIGQEKETIAYMPDGVSMEPELMYKLATDILIGRDELAEWAGRRATR